MERQGLLVRDIDNSYLTLEPCDGTGMDPILGSFITFKSVIERLLLITTCHSSAFG
jgi:hypothetical protein